MLATRTSTYEPGRGARATLAAVLALLALAVLAPPSQAQAVTPWPCDAYGYLFQTPVAGTNEVMQVDLATGQQTKLLDLTHPVNAVGFNQLDGFYYGLQIDQTTTPSTYSVVRIHPDGSVDEFGLPTGPGGTVAESGYHIGDVDPNGHYWMTNGVDWYQIDLTTPTPTVLDSGTVTFPATTGGIADWSWTQGALHAIANPVVAGEAAHLVRFNPATGAFSDLGEVGFTAGGVGATFVDASGYLYASQNSTGNVYRVDIATRDTVLASTGRTSAGNDGGRCASAPIPTITVTKTVNGRVRPADQFTVGLVRPDGSAATSATTSGTQTTVSTTNFPASQGQTYTITEAMAAGSPTALGEYVTAIECTDADGDEVAVGGTRPGWTLAVAEATAYSCNITNSAVADVRLAKSAAPTPVVPGEEVTYSLAVTNDGPSTATNVRVSDTLAGGLTFVSASSGCSEVDGAVTCALAALAPGASHTFTVTAQTPSSLTECPRNSASVTSNAADPDPANNTASVCPVLEGESDLALTKTPSRPQVPQNGQIMYTLVVENNGPSDATGVRVVDPLGAGLTLVAASPSQGECSTTGNRVVCDIGGLADGGSAQVLVTASVGTALGPVTNTATVTGSQTDPDPEGNTSTSTITVVPGPEPRFDLSVAKSVNDTNAHVGQRLRYRVVVTNTGPDAAPNVRVTDTLNQPARVLAVRTPQGECSDDIPLACELGTIPAGETVTIRIVARLWQTGREQRNAASVTGSGTDTDPSDNISTVDVRVRKVRLAISKVASSSTVQAGQRFGYRIRVRNRTRGVARRVRVCDRLPRGLALVKSKPRSRVRSGQHCWTIKRLKARQTKTFRVRVRALRGASGRKVNRVVANSRDARRARGRRAVRIRAGGVLPGGVTG